MKIDHADADHRVFIIAEIGNNHEGDVERAREMIRLAARAGVDAVKFQTIKTEELVGRENQARFDQLKRFELSHSDFERLHETAREAGIIFLSTPFDLDSLAFLAPLVPAIKIGSCENTFYPLLEAAAKTGKPVLLSGGLATMSELAYSKEYIERVWRENGIAQELAVLHCVTSYPCPHEDANLAAIPAMRDALQCTVGYSDHTLGIEAAAPAVALGARIIEKHFTLDKALSEFRDHQLSADPADMAELVRRVRLTEAMLGTGEKAPRPAEQPNLTAVRRSIVAKTCLPAGKELEWNDLRWVRPGGGLEPGQEARILGRRLLRALEEGERIMPEDVEK